MSRGVFPACRSGELGSSFIRVADQQDRPINRLCQCIQAPHEACDLAAYILIPTEEVRDVIQDDEPDAMLVRLTLNLLEQSSALHLPTMVELDECAVLSVRQA